MPWLAAVIVSGFSGVTAWLTAYFSKKVAVGVALGAFLIAGWIALQVGLQALWTGLTFTIPSEITGALSVVAYLLPANFVPCMQALVLARVGRWLWDRQREWALAIAQA